MNKSGIKILSFSKIIFCFLLMSIIFAFLFVNINTAKAIVLSESSETVFNACDYTRADDGLAVNDLPDAGINGDKYLGETNNGKTADYSITAETAGAYSIKTVYASTTESGIIKYEIDGINAGSVKLSATEGWESFTKTTDKTYFMLNEGEHVLKVTFLGVGYNVNSYILTYEGASLPDYIYKGTELTTNVSVFINACDFYETEDNLVCNEKSGETITGGKFLSETNNGKSAEYQIKAEVGGIYSIVTKYGAALPGGSVTYYIDETEVATTKPFDVADGWEVFSGNSVAENLELSAGEHILKVKFNGTNYNVNGFDISFVGVNIAEEGTTYIRLLDYINCSAGISEGGDSFEFGGLTGKVANGIGWSSNWTEYKLYVESAGLYNVYLGYSAPIDYPTTKIALTENDNELTVFEGFASTGGWTNWANSTAATAFFEEGVHNIKVITTFGAGGLNFITLSMEKASSYNISGQLTKEGDNSVINEVTVELYEYDGSAITGAVLNTAISDEEGNFSFQYISSGSYAIKAGNVIMPVIVNGADVDGVELIIPEVVSKYSISGRLIKGGDTSVIEEVTLYLYNYDGTNVTGEVLQSAVSGADGVFEFDEKVLNGNYAIKTGDSIIPVTVNNADVSNVEITVLEPVIKVEISADKETYINACDFDTAEGEFTIKDKTGISGNRFLGETNSNKKAHYTILVKETGKYNLKTIIAGPAADQFGSLVYYIDNVEIGSAATFSTGDWENFSGQTLPVTLSLTEGTHTFTVEFVGQNYNVNAYIFTPENMEVDFEGTLISPVQVTELNATEYETGDPTLVKRETDGVKYLGETNSDKTATYKIKVDVEGVYSLYTTFGGIGDGTLYYSIDSVEVGSANVYSTGGWGVFTGETDAVDITLSPGEHNFTVTFGGQSGYDVVSYFFEKSESFEGPVINNSENNVLILTEFDNTNNNGLSLGSDDFSDGDYSGKVLNGAGWNNYGEYNVYVAEKGNYKVKFRYSTPADNNTIVKLYSDNLLLATFDDIFVSTEGWSNWTDSVAKQIELSAGMHTIKLVFEGSGGVNFITANFEYVPESTYSVGGIVTNSEGQPIASAALDLYKYNVAAGAITGDLIETIITDEQGAFSAQGLTDGNYAVIINNEVKPFVINGSDLTDFNISIVFSDLPSADECVTITSNGVSVIQFGEYDEMYGFPASFEEEYEDGDVFGNVVGNLFSGYWAKYYINVEETGEYILKFRYSNITETATIRFWDDIVLLGEIKITATTGGWYSWTDSAKIIFPLTEGVHILKVTIETGSGGLNYTAMYIEKAVYYSASGNLIKGGIDSVIDNIEIKLYNYDGTNTLDLIETVVSDQNGAFAFNTNLLNGEYALIINGRTSLFTISGEDKTNITVEIAAPTYALSGTLSKGDENAIIANVELELYEYDGTNIVGKSLQSTKSKNSGEFTFSRKIESGNYAILVNGIIVPVTVSGNDKSDVSIALKTLYYDVSGIVTNADGSVAANVAVKLYDLNEDGSLNQVLKETSTDSNGMFTFEESVTTGNYALAIGDKIENIVVSNEDVIDVSINLETDVSTNKQSNTGLIIGLSVGGAVIVIGVVVVLLIIRKKKQI